MKNILLFFYLFTLFSCSSNPVIDENIVLPKILKILSLGDSYTIGQGVCATCKFPEQLKDSLSNKLSPNYNFSLQVIAQTGWTTTNLKSAINTQNPTKDFDLVTLLIGVNNQFQNRPFSLYETEFPELLNTAITLAKGDKKNVIVVSIPDYAFTPFGQNRPNPANISLQIDQYNNFAKNYCNNQNITFVNITDITRLGLMQPNLVANDQLHPSALAYSKFVERLLPFALSKID
jgi:lysophospholipase L1-like esterase